MTQLLWTSSDLVSFFVPGTVVGKQRAKASTRGNYVQMYTPAKTVNYEATVRMAAEAAMGGRELLMGAVDVAVHVQVVPSASWSKKRKAACLSGEESPTGKPDLDNVLKSLFDGMNGIVWRDDVLVSTVFARKRFDTAPGVQVTVFPPGSLTVPTLTTLGIGW